MQSRISSLIETLLNTFSGFIVAYISAMIVYPMFGFNITAEQNFYLTSIFTVVSIIRGYIWRRIFNAITLYNYRKQLNDKSI
jgi:hypothetical protein